MFSSFRSRLSLVRLKGLVREEAPLTCPPRCCPLCAGRLSGGGSSWCGTCRTGWPPPVNTHHKRSVGGSATTWRDASFTVKVIHHLVSGADSLLAAELTHSGKPDAAVVVKVVVDAQMVAVPAEEAPSLGRCSKSTTGGTGRSHPPGKVVPLVHVDAVCFVGHDLIEEGLLFGTTFIRPLGGELELSRAALVLLC